MAEQFPTSRAFVSPAAAAAFGRFAFPIILKWIAGNFKKRGFKGAAAGLLMGFAMGAELDTLGDSFTLAFNPEADVTSTLTEQEHYLAMSAGSAGGAAVGFGIDSAIKRKPKQVT